MLNVQTMPLCPILCRHNVTNPIAECTKKKPIRNRTQNGQKGHILLPTKKRKNFPLSTFITLTAPIKMSKKKKKSKF